MNTDLVIEMDRIRDIVNVTIHKIRESVDSFFKKPFFLNNIA